MPFELRIALRYLMARRKQAFISVISGISILGVAVGVMAVRSGPASWAPRPM
jgi:lipoprotein-releasing system permease protein